MRLLIQRVKKAHVDVDDKRVGEIEKGLLVFFGIHKNDDEKHIPWLVNKLIHLRIFNDDAGKMNLSVTDIGGGILLVSQFTLYADCNAGRRPDLFHAASGPNAIILYDEFVRQLKEKFNQVATGIFGADMQIGIQNDGPVTVLIEKGPDL